MAAVLSVAIWRPHSGKMQEFMAGVATAKQIHERLGGTVRVRVTQFGGVPMSVSYAIEHASFADFGAFGEKMSTDNEWAAFWGAAQVNPTAELVSNSVLNELAV
jgi:hypothetical protein